MVTAIKEYVSLVIPSRKTLVKVLLTSVSIYAVYLVYGVLVSNWVNLQFALTNPTEMSKFREIYTEAHQKTTSGLWESLKVQ